jgi:hypothetical protein
MIVVARGSPGFAALAVLRRQGVVAEADTEIAIAASGAPV